MASLVCCAVADTLLQAGADLTARNEQGLTCLHTCISNGCVSTLKYLINHGADTAQVCHRQVLACT